jgi:hypothetical protein
MRRPATGRSAAQIGRRRKAATAGTAKDSATRARASAALTSPRGMCRPAVRSFAASNLRSATRLKAFAAVLPPRKAATSSRDRLSPGQPSEAARLESARKEKEKIEWLNMTSSP